MSYFNSQRILWLIWALWAIKIKLADTGRETAVRKTLRRQTGSWEVTSQRQDTHRTVTQRGTHSICIVRKLSHQYVFSQFGKCSAQYYLIIYNQYCFTSFDWFHWHRFFFPPNMTGCSFYCQLLIICPARICWASILVKSREERIVVRSESGLFLCQQMTLSRLSLYEETKVGWTWIMNVVICSNLLLDCGRGFGEENVCGL